MTLTPNREWLIREIISSWHSDSNQRVFSEEILSELDETRAKLATAERLLKVKPKVIIHDEPHLHQLLSERDRALERIVKLRDALEITENYIGLILDGSEQNNWYKAVKETLAADDEAAKQGNVT